MGARSGARGGEDNSAPVAGRGPPLDWPGTVRRHHAKVGLRWTPALAAAGVVGGALIALLWISGPLAETTEAPTGRESALAAAPPVPSLPAPPPPAPAAAPAPTIQPVQPLAATAVVTPLAARASGAPRSFGSLDVVLLQPSGKPAIGAVVGLSAPRTSWQPDAATKSRAVVAESGRVEWRAVPAETELQIGITDALGYGIGSATVTLAPHEHRQLTQRIETALRSLVVRVVDNAGRGLAAEVTLHADTREETFQPIPAQRFTDSGGRAAFVGLAAERVSVWAKVEGFAPIWRDGILLDRDPVEIVLALEAPSSGVDVEIVDDLGAPRDVDSVVLTGPPMTVLAERIAPGWYRFAHYPRAATGIVASVQGRTWNLKHSADEPLASLVVPASGSLSVTWDRLPAGYEPNGVFITSDPPAWGWFEPLDAGLRAGRGPVRFETLAPGEYTVRLNCPNAPMLSGPPDVPPSAPNLSAQATVASRQMTEVKIEP